MGFDSNNQKNKGSGPAVSERWLLTPGPLTTDPRTREAMLSDWGSWDAEFRELTAGIRQGLLELAFADDTAAAEAYDCVPMQGSGSFLVEAMLGSFVSREDKVLVLCNGAYGKRVATTLDYLQRPRMILDKGDYLPPRADEVDQLLAADPAITHVVLVHCETSSGILNPVAEIAEVTKRRGIKLLIDSMSAFGALPLDMQALDCEAMVSSANKCIEGAPGFGFVIAKKRALEEAANRSHSLSLDLHAQWKHMNETGQWRFTPPTHVVAAFATALQLHQQEGGQKARLQRYTDNRDTLVDGMRTLGFETLLDHHWLSPIIVTFFNPAHPNFEFQRFYDELKKRGFIIYPGKLTVVDSFRVGCIGSFDKSVMSALLTAIAEALQDLGVDDASAPVSALEERRVLLELPAAAGMDA